MTHIYEHLITKALNTTQYFDNMSQTHIELV